MVSTSEYAQDMEKTLPHIDLIVVSAGVNYFTRGSNFTNDGFETTMQVNYLGPFLLVEKLMPRLRNTASGGRVVFLSSDVHSPSKPVIPEDVDPKENPEENQKENLKEHPKENLKENHQENLKENHQENPRGVWGCLGISGVSPGNRHTLRILWAYLGNPIAIL